MQITFQRLNKDHTRSLLQDFLHSNQKLKDEDNKSCLGNSVITACFCSDLNLSDMRNPKNRKSFFQGRIKIFKIRMNQGKIHHAEGLESVCSYVTLIGS